MQVFADQKVVGAIVDSLIISSSTTALAVLLGAPAAYALARFEFRGKSDLWFWFISNRMISPIVLALPIYLLALRVKLLDTHLLLILIYLTFNLPIVIWICTDQFRSIPRELEQAARLDGADQWTIFRRIYVPLGLPGIAVSAIFSFIFSWNELLYALVLTRRGADGAGRGDELHVRLRTALGEDHGDRHAHRAAGDDLRPSRLPPYGPRLDYGRHQVTAFAAKNIASGYPGAA